MARPTYRGFRGDHLRQLREEQDWTQEALGARVGTPPTAVSRWERGLVVPEAAQVARLARALGVPPQVFTSVPTEQARVTDLRQWAGYTRDQVVAATRLPERRLEGIEHVTVRPSPAEAAALAELYGVTAEQLLAAWERERAVAGYDQVADR